MLNHCGLFIRCSDAAANSHRSWQLSSLLQPPGTCRWGSRRLLLVSIGRSFGSCLRNRRSRPPPAPTLSGRRTSSRQHLQFGFGGRCWPQNHWCTRPGPGVFPKFRLWEETLREGRWAHLRRCFHWLCGFCRWTWCHTPMQTWCWQLRTSHCCQWRCSGPICTNFKWKQNSPPLPRRCMALWWVD